MKPIRAFQSLLLLAVAPALAQSGGGFDLTWNTIDGGGAASGGGAFVVIGTIGQPDAGLSSGGSLRTLAGGFWALALPDTCYANCDASTAAPILNVADFICFINRFTTGSPYANCDGSTAPPAINVQDFNSFINKFSGGCP